MSTVPSAAGLVAPSHNAGQEVTQMQDGDVKSIVKLVEERDSARRQAENHKGLWEASLVKRREQRLALEAQTQDRAACQVEIDRLVDVDATLRVDLERWKGRVAELVREREGDAARCVAQGIAHRVLRERVDYQKGVIGCMRETISGWGTRRGRLEWIAREAARVFDQNPKHLFLGMALDRLNNEKGGN